MEQRVEDKGQATVELALVLPFIMALLLALVQLSLVIVDQLRIVNAAREAARVSAVTPGDQAPLAAALRGSGLQATRLKMTLQRQDVAGGNTRVKLSYKSPTDVPMVGVFIPDPILSAEVVMRVES